MIARRNPQRQQQRPRGRRQRLARLVAVIIATFNDHRGDAAPGQRQSRRRRRRPSSDNRHRHPHQRNFLGFGRLRGRTPPSTGRCVTRDSSAATIASAVFCCLFFAMVTPRSTCMTDGKELLYGSFGSLVPGICVTTPTPFHSFTNSLITDL